MNAIDEVRHLLGPVDPARTLPVYTSPPPLLVPPPAHRPRPRRWALVVAGAAAALTVTGVLLVNPLASDNPAAAVTPPLLDMEYGGDPAPHAGRYLSRLAERLTAAPSDATSGRYVRLTTKGWYLSTVMTQDTAVSATVPIETRLWLAPDGSGRETVRKLPPELPDGDTRERWDRLAPHTLPADPIRDLRPGEWHFDWPGGLPTDPRRLAAGLGSGDALEPLLRVFNANRELIPDRAARAALLRHLATLDNLAYRGEVTDRAGRAGIAVSADTPDGGRREMLVFAPDTGELIAHETMIMREPGKLGLPRYPAVVAYTLFLDRAHVDRVGG